MSWKSLIENINNSNKVINKIDPTQANGSLLAMYYPCFTKEETEVEVSDDYITQLVGTELELHLRTCWLKSQPIVEDGLWGQQN